MKLALFSVTEQGRQLSQKLAGILNMHQIVRYCHQKHSDDAQSFSDIINLTGQIFHEFDGLIYICACGIAVRAIASSLKSKASDPAVLVIDNDGKFVISLLSGHLGRANALTAQIAEKIQATPVITTATDIGKLFSPDSFALANHLIINDLQSAKIIASEVLNGEKIGLMSDYPYQNKPDVLTESLSCRTGIYIGTDANQPFPVTLHLIPKNIVLGIGCRKNIPPEKLETQIFEFLADSDLFRRVCAIATIDLKKTETALLKFAEKYHLELYFYTSEELMSVPGEFSGSDFVKQITGTDNICERSAVRCARGSLIMRKQAAHGVTLAAAEKKLMLDFERSVML